MTDIVASLAVQVGADIGGLRSGLRDATNRISGFSGDMSRSLSGIGQQLQGIGTDLTVTFAPATAAMAAGIKIAADYETVMAEIGARAGLTEDQLASVSAFALQMGESTVFSATQAAEGLLQLLTSGQSVEEAIATLPAVINAAAAGGIELGRAADDVTNIMASFGLGVEDAAMVVDALARASGASSAEMGGLATGFADVGGIAASYGLTVEQTAAALAVLAENGSSAATAGTQLKSMLLGMDRDTEAAKAAWVELGTSMYDAEGNIRDLPTVLNEIQAALETRTAEDANQIMTDLWGSFGRIAGEALTGAIGIEDMQASMEGSTSAAEVAAARMDTFAGSIDTFKGSLETLAIKTITPFMNDTLQPLVEMFTKVVGSVIAWSDENPALTRGIVILGSGLAIVGPVIFGIGTALRFAGTMAGLFSGNIGGMALPFLKVLGPIAAVGVAIAGVVLALEDFNSKIEKSEEIGKAAGASLSEGAPGVFANEAAFNEGMFAELAKQHGDLYARYLWGTATFQAALVSARNEYFAQALERANSIPMSEINAEARMGEIGNGMIGGWGDPEATVKPMGNMLGIALGEGVSEGITASTFNAQTAMQNMVSGVNDTATSGETGWGIDSPSTVYQGYGMNIVEGLALGISQNVGLAQAAIGTLASTLEVGWKAVAAILNKLTPAILAPLTKVENAFDNVTKAANAAVSAMSAAMDAGAAGGAVGSAALGGYAPAGGPVLVGEQGPELFFPNSGGSIVPNHKLGGGNTYVLTAYGQNPHELMRIMKMAAAEEDR